MTGDIVIEKEKRKAEDKNDCDCQGNRALERKCISLVSQKGELLILFPTYYVIMHSCNERRLKKWPSITFNFASSVVEVPLE